MKKIEAIVRSEKISDIRNALEKINYTGLTLTQVDGHGNQKGTIQKWKGVEHKITIIPKTKVEIVVDDGDVQKIIEAIADAARTGEVGDGKIFVYAVETVMRIRTGQCGSCAL
ncbi:MAG: P-II family nitrogen regulator [Candidatus Omnitrophica bacterium]|jgi:nitrogen regulatory protein P-II 1|nr:P-II family nitrogen regulator [Candidatus Omnitrophota bacterium]